MRSDFRWSPPGFTERKRMKKFFALAVLVTLIAPIWAATQSVTLSVPDMNCAACPITVKKSLTKVSGVSKTEISLDRREAKVMFDDAKTNVEALTRATREAGYPSTVAGAAK